MTSEEYINKSKKRGWRFNLLISDSDAKNLQYIHPLKQELVNAIASRAKEDKNVRRVIIFGSATTNLCNPFSDLDVCIDWMMPSHDEDGVFVAETRPFMKYISVSTNGNCDILALDDVSNEEIREGIENGVVIYEYDV